MGKKYFKNFITSLLIVSFLSTPYFIFVENANAQSAGGYSSGGSYGVGSYLKNVGPVIKQLPLCKGKITGAVKSLFGGVNLGKAGEVLGVKGTLSSFAQTASDAVSDSQTIGVDVGKELKNDVKKTLDKATATQKGVDDIARNDTCLKSIGRMVIKLMLQKITLSTVAWINNGFEGKPLFLQNPGKFFEDIAKNEIRAFGLEIDDPVKYPYAKNWLRNQVNAYNRKFADNAQYSLNELITETTPQYNAITFSSDFSKGGWNAWRSLTSVPANNPLGFQLMASNELRFRLEGTQTSPAAKIQKALDQANGYLGDERCAEPEGITKEMHQKALIDGERDSSGNIIGICKRWEYVTPGQMVAQAATKAINYPDNNLLNADDLNDAIGAILDALLNKWSSDITNKGFADFSNEGSGGAFVLDNDAASASGYSDPQTERDFPSWQLGSDWLEQHPDFNIRTDLNQAIIDEQRIYIEKLEKQNEVIPELVKSIRQLDYCIPGPRPDWESAASVDNFYDTIKYSPVGLETPLLDLLPAFDPTGIVSGIATAILENSKERQVKRQVATYLSKLYDVHIYGAIGAGDNNEQDQVLDEDGIRNVIENTFETYRKQIYKMYNSGANSLAPMPLVTTEARNEYNKIVGYEQIGEDNFEEITFKKSVVVRLVQIKEAIEALGGANANEDDLRPWISFFGRLTKDMVTGDDVAKADSLLKELESQKKYVWDDLLKGPGGCEEEVKNIYSSNNTVYSKFYRRQPYGTPVYYLYGAPGQSTAPLNPNTTTPWSQNAVQSWSTNEGFLYGSVYVNNWVVTPTTCPEFVGWVEISLPNIDKDTGNTTDLGGLESYPVGPYNANVCGVVTRKFEKMFGIY